MNANEDMLAGNADADACFPDADPDMMLLNFDTGYADANTDFFTKIMSLYCTSYYENK